MGEVLKASPRLSLQNAQDIVTALLGRYEHTLEQGNPEGYSFQQIYDVERERVNPAFQSFYQKMKEELEALGLTFTSQYT
jgi:methylamine--corrinoid protein Co-methyltransferase